MTWLDAAQVTAILGSKLTADVDQDALQECCDAARSYVEGRRPDLFVSDGGDPPAFNYASTASVIHGAALYALRLYKRRGNPTGAGIPGEDRDVERLLGIGRSRGFRFGGARPLTTEVV